jgi:protein TonB
VGGDVQAGNLIYHPSPAYPSLARTARIEGVVILSATIAEDGTIKDLKVISTSNPLLSTGVLDTVKTWKYKPTLLNKEPVEVITTITVNFTLGR